MKTVSVRLNDRSYQIDIEKGLLSEVGAYAKKLSLGKKALVLSDTRVAPLYAAKVISSLKRKGFQPSLIKISAGEKSKSIEVATKIWKQLLKLGLDRSSFIVALGGGVVGDLAGFIAATYLRGIPFIQVPTTLLAQVDSSVGGKVGINLEEGKNLVGSFYQPQAVIIDSSVLKTLSKRDFKAGMAEVIKYGAIWDKSFFHFLEENIDSIYKCNQTTLATAISKSCQIKSIVVEMDEKELGLRAVLNFGHTFGHAYEAAAKYKNLRHGEAIAVGMIAAAELSYRMKLCSKEVVDAITLLIKKAGLPTQLPHLSFNEVKKHMLFDKKAKAGKLSFILLESIGKVIIRNNIPSSIVDDVIKLSLKDV